MKFSKQEVEELFSQHKSSYVICDGNLEGGVPELDYSMEFLSLFIATQGELTFTSRGQTVTADSSCVQFFLKDVSLQVHKVSDSYRSRGIIFSKDYWRDNLLSIHPYLNLSIVHPALKVTPEQKRELMEYAGAIQTLNETGTRQDSPVIRALFEGMFKKLGQLYYEWADSFCQPSESLLFTDFCELLFTNYKSERSVLFYADKLGISPSTLSARIKKISGKTVSKCISKYTISRLCSELGNTSKSIKELAIEYHFNDSSHLCKFFKSNVGETLESYRQKCHQFNL